MKTQRLMCITYRCTQELIDRLKTCLDMCCIKYVIYKEWDFVGGESYYKIYIDKNKCTWEQVKREVNRVKPVKFRFTNEYYMKDGLLYCPCN